MRVVLIGPPGAGKGTQALRLSQKICHTSAFDRRHAEIRGIPSNLNRAEVAQIMERGELVPDQLVVSVIVERISQPDVARGFILDGFPRTVFQAAALDGVLLIEERELSCVLELKVDERILLDRILGRAVQAKGQRRAGESR